MNNLIPITRNLATNFGTLLSGSNVGTGGTGASLFNSLITGKSNGNLAGLSNAVSQIPLSLFQPTNIEPGNPLGAGLELAKPLVPIGVKAITLAASPNYGP